MSGSTGDPDRGRAGEDGRRGEPATFLERCVDRLAAAAIRLYPYDFRARYGEDMRRALADRLRADRSRGLPRRVGGAARALAELALSGLRERVRPAELADGVLRDLRLAVRSLMRAPLFTAVAAGTLAVGIGANTAIFSVVDGVLLRPLPYPEPERVGMILSTGPGEPGGRVWMSRPDLEDLRELPLIEHAAGVLPTTATITEGGSPEVLAAARVTGDLMATLGVTPRLGRDLAPDETGPGSPGYVVIGHELWMERYGGDPGVVGRTLEISERPWEIVGVAPRGLDFPSGARLWLADRNAGSPGCGRGCHTLHVVARTAVDIDSPGVAEQLDALAGRLAEAYPASNADKGFRAVALDDHLVGDVRSGLWILLGAVVLVLLIACANVGGLFVARAAARRREIAVRSALGAGRGRLALGALAESAVLAGVAGVAGLGLAHLAAEALPAVAGSGIPRIDEVRLDRGVLVFNLVVTVAVALLFGLAPSLRRSEEARFRGLTSGRRTGGHGERRFRSLLVGAEVAVSVVLVVGAGLLLRSVSELRDVELGFRADDVTRFKLALPSTRYHDLSDITTFFQELERELEARPDVASVGSVYGAPLSDWQAFGTVLVEGRPEPEPSEEVDARMQTMTPGYLETMGIPVVRGRGLEPSDGEPDAPGVAVVNETFAQEVFGGEDPLGERVRVTVDFGFGPEEGPAWWRIVGVVGDVRADGPRADPPAELYAPQARYGPGYMEVHVRGESGASGIAEAARSVVASLDPKVPLRDVRPLGDVVDAELATTRFYVLLLTLFAGVALLLAAVGLYGVVAYLVSRRTREIGVRMAVGADAPRLVRTLLADGMRPAGAGLVVGLVVAAVGSRLLESLLFGVSPGDPVVLCAGAGLVLFVAALATWLPVRRAVRVDPTTALREA